MATKRDNNTANSVTDVKKKLSKMGEYLKSGKPYLEGVEYDMALVLQ